MPGRRRVADPFAPWEETKYTFVGDRARVRVRRRTVTGRRVRGPRACLAVPGLQRPRGPGVALGKGVRRTAGPGRAGPTFLQSRVGPDGRPDSHAPAPAGPWHFAAAAAAACDFAFRALGRAGNGRAGSRGVGVRVRP